MSGRAFGTPESGDWHEAGEGGSEIVREPNLVYGWALYTGTGGDDPYFIGFFRDKAVADFLLDATGNDDEPLLFEPALVPAVMLGDHKQSKGIFSARADDDEMAKEALVVRFGGDVQGWDRRSRVLP